jgi:hypothetical protein
MSRLRSPTRPQAPSRRAEVLVLAAFTPYLGTVLSIRVEHLIVYGLLVGLMLDPDRLGPALKQTRSILLPWLLLAALVVANTLLNVVSSTGGLGFAAIEQLLRRTDSFLLQAVALVLGVAHLARRPENSRLQLRRAGLILLVLVSANSLLILLANPFEIDTVLRQFWTNPNVAAQLGTPITAERELSSGRYGGIFNQPFDGGLMYAFALMIWWYVSAPVLDRGIQGLPLPMVSLGLIFVGGLSTGSKVFLAGLLIFAAQVLLIRTGHIRRSLPRRVRLVVVSALGAIGVVWIELADFSRLWDFVDAFGSDTTSVSGGRFSSLGEYGSQVLGDLSILGSRGFYTDDALRAYLTGGGVVGVLLFVAVYAAFFRMAGSLPRGSGERWLAFGLTLVALGASFGSVSLQTIRASTILWVFMGLLLGHSGNIQRLRRATPPMVHPARVAASRRGSLKPPLQS